MRLHWLRTGGHRPAGVCRLPGLGRSDVGILRNIHQLSSGPKIHPESVRQNDSIRIFILGSGFGGTSGGSVLRLVRRICHTGNAGIPAASALPARRRGRLPLLLPQVIPGPFSSNSIYSVWDQPRASTTTTEGGGRRAEGGGGGRELRQHVPGITSGLGLNQEGRRLGEQTGHTF